MSKYYLSCDEAHHHTIEKGCYAIENDESSVVNIGSNSRAIKSPDIPFFITFNQGGNEVGRFSIINGKLEFSGDTDISAQMFVEKVCELFNNSMQYEKIKEMCFKGESEG